MLARNACTLALAALLLAGTAHAAPAANPLLAPSGLPYGAPRFDHLGDADYGPALEAAIAAHGKAVAAIAANPAPPSFDNTMVAMERAGGDLALVVQVFENVVQANSDETLEATRAAMEPKLQADDDAMHMNPALFARVRTLYDRRETLGLDAKSRFLLEQTYKKFVDAGAALSDADKERLRALNQRITTLQTEFQKRLLAATAAGAVVVDSKDQLAGLPDDEIAAAAAEADARHMHGKYVLALQNTTQQPVLAKLTDRALRARILRASEQRGAEPGPEDERDIVASLAQLRAGKAKLLGFASFAALTLHNQMAKTPQRALALMDRMVPAATASARRQAAEMQAIIDAQHGGFELAAYDWERYADQLRRRKYDLDDAATRPYFELNRVLHDGVFFAANRLYGVTFKERHDIPVYQADVRTFEMFDADGAPLALIYFDYFARANKQGGAWCDDLVPPSGLLGRKPVVVNVANFAKPAPGKPALLSFDDVTTMFHEFGHALHTIFSNQYFPSQNGFGVPTDMVEFPSQFNEHWALDPTVLASYAHDYRTGAPMPPGLAAKLRGTHTFDQGYMLTEYLAAALLDMEWHSLPAAAPKQDVGAFEPEALRRHHVDLPQVPPRYRTTYFQHIWSNGYAANYYAYLWGEVLDDDAFAWFEENGGLTRKNGQRFRDAMLAPGFTADPMDLYRRFRGREPSVQPLLRARGLQTQG